MFLTNFFLLAANNLVYIVVSNKRSKRGSQLDSMLVKATHAREKKSRNFLNN
jgi:hypothetical protein